MTAIVYLLPFGAERSIEVHALFLPVDYDAVLVEEQPPMVFAVNKLHGHYLIQ